MRDWKDATGSNDFVVGYYHCTVVEWTVFEENVLDKALCDAGIDGLAGTDVFCQGDIVLQHDECTHFLFAHIDAGHDDGEDGFSVVPHAVLVGLVP